MKLSRERSYFRKIFVDLIKQRDNSQVWKGVIGQVIDGLGQKVDCPIVLKGKSVRVNVLDLEDLTVFAQFAKLFFQRNPVAAAEAFELEVKMKAAMGRNGYFRHDMDFVRASLLLNMTLPSLGADAEEPAHPSQRLQKQCQKVQKAEKSYEAAKKRIRILRICLIALPLMLLLSVSTILAVVFLNPAFFALLVLYVPYLFIGAPGLMWTGLLEVKAELKRSSAIDELKKIQLEICNRRGLNVQPPIQLPPPPTFTNGNDYVRNGIRVTYPTTPQFGIPFAQVPNPG